MTTQHWLLLLLLTVFIWNPSQFLLGFQKLYFCSQRITIFLLIYFLLSVFFLFLEKCFVQNFGVLLHEKNSTNGCASEGLSYFQQRRTEKFALRTWVKLEASDVLFFLNIKRVRSATSSYMISFCEYWICLWFTKLHKIFSKARKQF